MDKPLISVVTPSWNQGEYLAECIESCRGGKANEVEHIVVDNLSDDCTHEVLARYDHVKTIVEKDNGQSDALNKGFAMAQGEWILWLNADDFLCPGMIERYLELVKQQENIDAIYGHMLLVDEESKLIRKVYQAQWYPWMIKWGVFALPSTGTLYRASCLREYPLSEDFHMVMDSEWSLRTMGKIRALRDDRSAVSFRVTETNKTGGNIMRGEINPRHAQERKNLAQKYPYYGRAGETERGALFYFGVAVIRKIGRLVLLADKYIARSSSGN